MRWFWLLWSIVTTVSALLCTAGCLLPYWLKGDFGEPHSFIADPQLQQQIQHLDFSSNLGLFRRCIYPFYLHEDEHPFQQSHLNNLEKLSLRSPAVRLRASCGHYAFRNIPHVTWRLGFIFLCVACGCLFFFSFLLFFIGFHITLFSRLHFHHGCQLGLMVAGLLVLLSCLLYPLGWSDNTEIAQICGEQAGRFNLGRCHIGWAYVLTLIGGLLAVLSASLPSLLSQELVRPSLVTSTKSHTGLPARPQQSASSLELQNKLHDGSLDGSSQWMPSGAQWNMFAQSSIPSTLYKHQMLIDSANTSGSLVGIATGLNQASICTTSSDHTSPRYQIFTARPVNQAQQTQKRLILSQGFPSNVDCNPMEMLPPVCPYKCESSKVRPRNPNLNSPLQKASSEVSSTSGLSLGPSESGGSFKQRAT